MANFPSPPLRTPLFVESRSSGAEPTAAGNTLNQTWGQHLNKVSQALSTIPTYADAETVAGSGKNWTLANTPSPSASLILVTAAGAVLLHGSGYAISGRAITTSASYAAGGLTAWYRY